MLVTLLSGLTIAAFAFVLLTLIMGAKSMGSKDTTGHEKSNKWMQRRVLGQFAVLTWQPLCLPRAIKTANMRCA